MEGEVEQSKKKIVKESSKSKTIQKVKFALKTVLLKVCFYFHMSCVDIIYMIEKSVHACTREIHC